MQIDKQTYRELLERMRIREANVFIDVSDGMVELVIDEIMVDEFDTYHDAVECLQSFFLDEL